MKTKHPLVISVLPGFSASTLLDVVRPLLRLNATGKIRFQTKLEQYTITRSLRKTSLVIFCRNTEPKYQKSLDFLIDNDIPYIYDLDDNLFEIPLDTELGQYHRAPERQLTLRKYISNAHLVRVYSKTLLDIVNQYTDRAVIVSAPLDWSLVRTPPRKDYKEKPIRIVYVTSRKEDNLWKLFSIALKDLLKNYDKQVEMYFWGYFPEEFSVFKNAFLLPYEPNYATFMSKFSKAGFDIGLAPLFDDNFHNAKTNNKFREYGSCKIAGIYSNVPVYSGCIQHKNDGYLVNNTPEEWYAALEQLVNDLQLRNWIIQNAYENIKANYSQTAFDHEWGRQINEILNSHERNNLYLSERTMPIAPAGDAKTQKPYWGLIAWFMLRYGQINKKYQKEGISGVITALRQELTNFYFLIKINLFKSI